MTMDAHMRLAMIGRDEALTETEAAKIVGLIGREDAARLIAAYREARRENEGSGE